MNQKTVNSLIADLKKAALVTKAAPWIKDEYLGHACEARFIGIKVPKDWSDFMSEKNNVLLKFIINKNTALMEVYLANQTPFLKVMHLPFSENSKWRHLLGEFKRRLNKDWSEYKRGTAGIANLYQKIRVFLK